MTPHSLSERGHILHVHGPWDGKEGSESGFPIRPMGDGFFHFRGAKTGFFFVKQLHGAHFSICMRPPRSGRTPPSHHISMSYVCASYVGIHGASCGVLSNPLESDRI